MGRTAPRIIGHGVGYEGTRVDAPAGGQAPALGHLLCVDPVVKVLRSMRETDPVGSVACAPCTP